MRAQMPCSVSIDVLVFICFLHSLHSPFARQAHYRQTFVGFFRAVTRQRPHRKFTSDSTAVRGFVFPAEPNKLLLHRRISCKSYRRVAISSIFSLRIFSLIREVYWFCFAFSCPFVIIIGTHLVAAAPIIDASAAAKRELHEISVEKFHFYFTFSPLHY